MRTRTTLSVAVLACCMAPAFAQTAAPGSSSGTGLGNRDNTATSTTATPSETKARHREALTSEEFVKEAAIANLSEIEASRTALEKAQDPAVRTFAQQMVSDHTKATDELRTLASSKGYAVPDEPDTLHKATMLKLKAMSGASFDKVYTEQMRKDHAKAVQLFSDAANSTQLDPELRQFAQKTLPTLQHHNHLAMKDLPKSGG